MAIVSPCLVILLACFHLEAISGANLLVTFPFPYRSHLRTFEPLLQEILKRGHNLTFIGSLSLNVDSEFQQYYTHINASKHTAHLTFEELMNRREAMPTLKNNFLTDVIGSEEETQCIENIIKDPMVQDLLHSKNHYDLVIAELFHSDIFFAFGSKFNAPTISLTSQYLFSFHNSILGNSNPSYFPNFSLGITENMSLVWRAINIVYTFMATAYYELYFLPEQQVLIDKYFHFEKSKVPSLKEILKNISVSLVNTHHTLGYLRPNLPNVVNVAGIHFTPSKPLPVDLQKFMDEAEQGIICVSLGSAIDPNCIESLGRSLINVLKMQPQKIIMKWNRKLLPDVPSNILVREWLPQSDILNHPNCRLLITHGGYLTLLEALNGSVPVLGIPFFGDQYHNIAMMEYFELGKKIELSNIDLDLPAKLVEVLNNPKYKQNVERRSSIFRDSLASPMDTAMFWIDHALQHKDMSHLKSVSVRLTWYEFYSLDVIGILVILIVAIIYTLKFIVFISSVLVLYVKILIWFNTKLKPGETKIRQKKD